MATNDDALSAIEDIKEAIAEYGSSVTISTYVAGETDSYGNVIIPESNSIEITKGLISSEATEAVSRANNSDINPYELAIKIYSETKITKAQKIIFQSLVHEIVYVSTKTLQDTDILYEVLIKR